MPLKQVDINVHPTKREVRFLYENDIAVLLQSNIQALLGNTNNERMFETKELVIPDMPVDDTTTTITKTTNKRSNKDKTIQGTIVKKPKLNNTNSQVKIV